jgi:hypothetical protein
LVSNLKTTVVICQSCTFDLHVLGEELLPVEKTFLGQKHHDLADKFRVWHVMCSDNPISCRSWILEARMARHVPLASLSSRFLWCCYQHCLAFTSHL